MIMTIIYALLITFVWFWCMYAVGAGIERLLERRREKSK